MATSSSSISSSPIRKRSRSNGTSPDTSAVGSLRALEKSMQLSSSWDSNEQEFANTFFQTFDLLQAVYLPGKRDDDQHNKVPRLDKNSIVKETSTITKTDITWQDIPTLFHRLNRQDQDSWCVETGTSQNGGSHDSPAKQPPSQLAPDVFWNNDHEASATSQHQAHRAYCSFLVQHDTTAYQETLERLPFQHFWKPTTDTHTNTTTTTKLVYEPCLWFFFGWNVPPPTNNDASDHEDMQGRPDHTDSISHDGTWHYQLSGSKRWYLRPSIKLLEHWKERLSSSNDDSSSSPLSSILSNVDLEQWLQQPETAPTICIECLEGDVIVVNTRLWWHRTVLPPQSVPSVSYARDFRVRQGSVPDDAQEQHQLQSDTATAAAAAVVVGMTNVDGLYATKDIEEGTILFTETDMPDCELHRSADQWNCQVVKLDDGTSAVVSSRRIAEGEFFCVPDSDEDEEEEDGEDDEEDQGDFVCVEIDEDYGYQ